MDCPKCGHRQNDTVKCGSCGVYFAKLAAPGTTRRQVAPAAPESSGFGLGALALVAVAAAGLVYYLMRQNHAAQSASAPVPGSAAPIQTAQILTLTPALQVVKGAAAANPESSGVDAIGAARNATVFIRTGWGLGSGFIVDGHCDVITNRHVVETDGTRVTASIDHNPDIQNNLALTQQRLLGAIYAAQLRRRILAGQPGTNVEQLQLDERIRQMQQTLASVPQLDAKIAEKVSETDRSGFSVTLPDGTHFEGLHAELSRNADLALIRLPAQNCAYIPAASGDVPRVGARVYTIGNPSGLAFTVTTGVVSGFPKLDGMSYVQTDAPINPGNSGGPLINEQGRVIGINSMVMRGVTGIGFAIPIAMAYAEFPQLGPAP
jgi:S1-C subfamily serine protease